MIGQEMAMQNPRTTSAEHGSAVRTWRFKLLPRPEPVLGILNSEDLFFFAHFTPARVKEILVPKYGRETLLPLFDIEKTESLVIKRPPGSFRQNQASSAGRPVEQSGDGLAPVKL
jgi:hypothetical protein